MVFNCCALLVNLSNAMITGLAGRVATGGVRFQLVMRAVTGVAFLLLAVKSAVALSRSRQAAHDSGASPPSCPQRSGHAVHRCNCLSGVAGLLLPSDSAPWCNWQHV